MGVVDFINLGVCAFIFSNAIVMSILFFSIKSKNKKANTYLGLFLCSIVVNIFNDFLSELSIEEELGVSLFIVEPFLFALPFLFFYMHATINKKIENWQYLLFIPGIVHNILLHSGGLFLTENTVTNYEATIYFLEIALMVYAFRILQNHEEKLVDFYSDLDSKSLTWLKSIFGLHILIHFLSISTFIFDLSHVEIVEYSIDISALGLTVFMIFWISYNGFTQPEIFKQRLFLATENNVSAGTANLAVTQTIILEKEIQKSNGINELRDKKEPIISEADIQQFKEIKEKIQEQELFTNPKLDLRALSEALDLKEKELSRLINECGKVNFYQFINAYRIEKFKQLVESSNAHHFTLLGLATEAGFSSKSTFYTAFKKLEGMTPKQYEKSIKKS